jgi:hypothetical protein
MISADMRFHFRSAHLGYAVLPPRPGNWTPALPPPDLALLRRVLAGLERLRIDGQRTLSDQRGFGLSTRNATSRGKL